MLSFITIIMPIPEKRAPVLAQGKRLCHVGRSIRVDPKDHFDIAHQIAVLLSIIHGEANDRIGAEKARCGL